MTSQPCTNENKGVGPCYVVGVRYKRCTPDLSQGSNKSTDLVVMDP